MRPETEIAIRATEDPVPLPVARVVPDSGGASQRYVNQEKNSRFESILPQGTWSVRWQLGTERATPTLILAAGDRILVEYHNGSWALIDSDGKPIDAGGNSRGADAVLDPASAQFYVMGSYLFARRLSDARLEFQASVMLGDRFFRTLVVRRGRHLLTVGIEREIPTHSQGYRGPTSSLVELVDLGDPIVTESTEYLRLTSLRDEAALMPRTTLLHSALDDQTLVLATTNAVYLLDWDGLRVRRALTGQFTPLAMSLDEAGRIYLIVRVGSERALWLLTPEGRGVMSFADVPESDREAYAPPVVGHDHRIYLFGDRGIVAIDPDGRLAWERPTNTRPAGAAITSDGQLIASVGDTLVTYDRSGARTELFAIPERDRAVIGGDRLTTAPVLTQDGALLVTSGNVIYCLRSAVP